MRLGTKFGLLVIGILTLTLGISSVYLIHAEREAAKMRVIANAHAQARLLALIAPDAIVGYDFILLNEYVEQITRDPDVIFAAVLDRSGTPLTSFLDRQDATLAGVLANRGDASVAELREALVGVPNVVIDRVPIMSNGKPLGEMVIAIDLSGTDRNFAIFLVRQATVYLGIIALLWVAIIAVFRLGILRPIRALIDGARRVGAGDYAQAVECTGRDELGMLTKSFNSMMCQIKEEREQLYTQANFDALTGLPNRKMALDRIRYEIERARREERGLAVLFIDLDNFKYINDTMGHAVGDKLLIEVGRRFKEQIRAVDLLARLGGDEYLVLTPSADSLQGNHVLADRLIQALAAPAHIDDMEVYIRCSVGIALYPGDGVTAEELMAAADSAMYAAKHNPIAAVQFYTRALNEVARRRVEVERDIYAALERQEFRLEYQPIVRLADGQYAGAEALLRWHHPQKGVIPPMEFIPIAEQTGQIDAVGDWVLEEACRAYADLEQSGLAPGFIAVNVSRNQLRRGFDEKLQATLERYRIAAGGIVIEITENVLLDDNPQLTKMFTHWRDAGIKVSLDDFGTGFSSLSYLSHFRFDTIKIDKSFVDGLMRSHEDRSVVAAIIAMAENLGIGTIAEGVEREEQRVLLRKLGCRHMQGFFHHRPMGFEAFKAYLAEARSGAAPPICATADER